MGALTLTGLIPDIYAAMNIIAREQVGFIPAVSRDSNAERAALNQTVRSPVVGAMVAEDLTIGNVSADTPNQTVGYVDMKITKQRSVPFGITGNESHSLRNAGTLQNINQQRITQALRTLTNEVELDLAFAARTSLSRAYGTPGTQPFGTAGDLSDFAQPGKILKDNGAPMSDLHMVLGSSAMANMQGKQSGLFKVNEAGTDQLLREGIITRVQGWGLHESAAIDTVASGTAAGATTNGTAHAKGDTVIRLAAGGTGAVLAGDVIRLAGSTDMYTVVSGDASVADGGQLTIAAPGLRQAIPAAATAITVIAASARNSFFQRAAIQLATRAPAMPEGGDMADDVMMVTDPVSGISYEFAVYKQKRQVRYEVNLAWGFAVPNPHLGGNLLG